MVVLACDWAARFIVKTVVVLACDGAVCALLARLSFSLRLGPFQCVLAILSAVVLACEVSLHVCPVCTSAMNTQGRLRVELIMIHTIYVIHLFT